MFLFFSLSLCCLMVEKDTFLRSNVLELSRHSIFSRVYIDLSTPCEIPELAQYCYGDCSVPLNGKIMDKAKLKNKRKSKEEKLTLVDLLKVPEAYTGYKEGAREVWMALVNLSNDGFYKSVLSGVQYSISVHICAFYKKMGGIFLCNPSLFGKICKPEGKVNFLKLLKFAKNSFKKMNIEKIEELFTKPELNKIYDIQSVILDVDQYYVNPDLLDVLDKALLVLNCTACEKCKLWGKIQFMGLRTFIKVQLNQKLDNVDELIYAVNFLARLVTSEYESARLESLYKSKYSLVYNVFIYYEEILGISLAFILYFVIFKKRRR
ncbi:Endoplasmic Reticulum Oxidoreductin 1 [Spraguea lophii 42_110]|uniref:Endoplasmic Reticulum Oxidoreductin 1 n=1 Tax=Spraguea lophii (strain 42_110) TaxID=1358809 RepID=S7XK08_SPRLO|nr:Endoplasmic Reticulum Oxidoreductin 1 [Spraguea lophii 42_110]